MCQYMPGEAVNELKIMEETGIGRTPVREALLALKEEGLIEIRPRKGTFACAITEFQINEMYQIRRLLEPISAVKYKQRLTRVPCWIMTPCLSIWISGMTKNILIWT